MPLNATFIGELKHESSNTRKMLARVPEDKFDWKPHEKSMTLGRLSCHVAEITQWVDYIINDAEFDFATKAFNRRKAASNKELMGIFEDNLTKALSLLESSSDEVLNTSWIMRRGEFISFNLPRKAAIRNIVMNHILHHRGQLSVYLRLLNVAVPGMYGPSADERP